MANNATKLGYAVVSLLSLVGCGSAYSYEGEVRGAVTTLGPEGALDTYVALAKSGDGEDLFRLYWLLEIDGHLVPNYPYALGDGPEAILNCAAQRGFNPAITRAAFRVQANQNARSRQVMKCLKQVRPQGLLSNTSRWMYCGAEKLLPSCPNEL